MGVHSVFLFSLLIGIVSCQKAFICDSAKDSLVPVTIFVTAEQYQACKEYGECTFNSPCVALDDSGVIQGSLEGKSYFEILQKISLKMDQLEAEHPDIKHLKLKLIQMIDSLCTEFEFKSSMGELISIKILDFVKYSIEKMKVELEHESTNMHKPKSIPVLKTIVHGEEVTAEPEHESDHSMLVGSTRGIPGIHFPNYTEIPITSFSCSDKTIIPGFYADLETGCQVFHLCYEHRRESFLCPQGTIFNQPILACDYWYSANCSQAPIYYEHPNILEPESISTLVVKENVEKIAKHQEKEVLKDFLKFLPVKAKVTDIATLESKPSVTLEDTEAVADKIFDGILSLGSHITSKASDKLRKLPDPQNAVPITLKSHLPLKTKLATKTFVSVPIIKAKKITAAAKLSAAALASGKIKVGSLAVSAAVPIKAKKVAAAAAVSAAVPIKAKKVVVAAAVSDAVLIKAKKFPIVKGKLFKLPLAKAKLSAAAIPAFKAKKTAKVLPYLKMAALKPKIAAAPLKVKSAVVLPLMKAKLAKAAISPLTKKTLALGYLKLLKAKKIAVMG